MNKFKITDMNKFKIGDKVVLKTRIIQTGWIIDEVNIESVNDAISVTYKLTHPEFVDMNNVRENELISLDEYILQLEAESLKVGDVVYFAPDSDECSFYNTPYVVELLLGDGDVMLEGNEWITKEESLISEAEYKENETPDRYASRLVNGMDVIDLAEHWNLNPQEMNILKYLLRDKGQDYEDMLKIADYANREAQLIKQREMSKTSAFGDWL